MIIDMRCHPGILKRNNQHGIVLLVLAIILALVVSVYYFKSISITEIKLNNNEQTRRALKEAKQALINYAVMHGLETGAIASGDPGEYGYLPCPFDHIVTGFGIEDGEQQDICGGKHKNSVGLLPWADLETDVLRDGSGNCLWYVVSGSYKNNTFSDLLNQDSNGMIEIVDDANNIIVGNNIKDRPVAIVIAPGAAINGQVRVNDASLACGTDGTQVAQYLDNNGTTDNAVLNGAAHVPDAFISAKLSSDPDDDNDNYNDQIITITREEIWQAVYNKKLEQQLKHRFAQVTEALAHCLVAYASHADNNGERLPYPAPLVADDYRDYTDYNDRSVADVASDGYAGRFPFLADNSNADIGSTFAGVVKNRYMNTPGLCDNILLNDGVTAVSLKNASPDDLYRKLYGNWKDHFFYALSEVYKPENTATVASCDGTNCIKVNGVEYAAVVIFAGQAQSGQVRVYDDAGTDDKWDPHNYLENNNADQFIDAPGNQTFNTSISPSNDIMYCVTNADPPQVVQC